jgi:hypothetical protein
MKWIGGILIGIFVAFLAFKLAAWLAKIEKRKDPNKRSLILDKIAAWREKRKEMAQKRTAKCNLKQEKIA